MWVRTLSTIALCGALYGALCGALLAGCGDQSMATDDAGSADGSACPATAASTGDPCPAGAICRYRLAGRPPGATLVCSCPAPGAGDLLWLCHVGQ
jgi:hypothetical protein